MVHSFIFWAIFLLLSVWDSTDLLGTKLIIIEFREMIYNQEDVLKRNGKRYEMKHDQHHNSCGTPEIPKSTNTSHIFFTFRIWSVRWRDICNPTGLRLQHAHFQHQFRNIQQITLHFGGKYMSQQVDQTEVPETTGPGIRRSMRPMLKSNTRGFSSMETSPNSVNGQVRW